jgi:hypothetical protein
MDKFEYEIVGADSLECMQTLLLRYSAQGYRCISMLLPQRYESLPSTAGLNGVNLIATFERLAAPRR